MDTGAPKGCRLGRVELSATAEDELTRTLRSRAMATGRHAGLRMVGICEVAGLRDFGGRFRAGSAAYELTPAARGRRSQGVGPLMLTVSEATRAGAPDASVEAT